jgi:subfamily B ATP-binding cassette protein MsbA
VAFVGESGSGKTTLVNLITGLMKVDGGAISVDGINYTDLDIRSLQKRIGYITQDPVVFSDSIYDNVTKWGERSEENISKFWDALNKAAIDDFVKDLPEMENTLMGNNGIQVSGGQKQRISIARELYKNAEILVMDEATSALDSETERAIQENIEALKGQYTLLIVAHRLSTVMSADEIILLSKGQIVDSGTYEELMARSELFKKMVKYQNLV